MVSILFCDSLQGLKQALERTPAASCRCLLLDDFCEEAAAYLHTRGGAVIAPGGSDLSAEERKSFHRDYAAFLGRLNAANRSFSWWAYRFSNKSPFASAVYSRVLALWRIRRFLAGGTEPLVVVLSADRALPRLFARLPGVPRMRVIKAYRWRAGGWCSGVHIIAAAARAGLRALMCRNSATLPGGGKQRLTVVFSLLNRQSLGGDHRYRDTYFGGFVQYLADQGRPYLLMLLGISPDCADLCRELRRRYPQLSFCTVHAWLGLAGVFACCLRALAASCMRMRVCGDTVFLGIDLAPVFMHAIAEEHRSGAYFHSLCVHEAVRRLCRTAGVQRIYYPFENRAFEKMIILAAREESADTRLIGYQHAALSRMHANFIVSPEEVEGLPLPDTIVAMGQESADFMTGFGGVPAGLVKPLCALRYEHSIVARQRSGRPLRNLLVVLSGGICECGAVAGFLKEAFPDGCSYAVWIRPHPGFAFGRTTKADLPFSFHVAGKETVAECLDWADLVIDVSSTLGLEALCSGLPVIHLDLSRVPRFDPPAIEDGLEAVVSSPASLPAVISLFDSLPSAEFQRRRDRAFAFCRRCFAPVTDQALEALSCI